MRSLCLWRAPPKNSQPRRRIKREPARIFQGRRTYSNDQIRFSLDVENLGGIRPALDAQGHVRHVAIMTAGEDSGKMRVENPYRDRIEGTSLPTPPRANGRPRTDRTQQTTRRTVHCPDSVLRLSQYRAADLSISRLLELLRHYRAAGRQQRQS